MCSACVVERLQCIADACFVKYDSIFRDDHGQAELRHKWVCAAHWCAE